MAAAIGVEWLIAEAEAQLQFRYGPDLRFLIRPASRQLHMIIRSLTVHSLGRLPPLSALLCDPLEPSEPCFYGQQLTPNARDSIWIKILPDKLSAQVSRPLIERSHFVRFIPHVAPNALRLVMLHLLKLRADTTAPPEKKRIN